MHHVRLCSNLRRHASAAQQPCKRTAHLQRHRPAARHLPASAAPRHSCISAGRSCAVVCTPSLHTAIHCSPARPSRDQLHGAPVAVRTPRGAPYRASGTSRGAVMYRVWGAAGEADGTCLPWAVMMARGGDPMPDAPRGTLGRHAAPRVGGRGWEVLSNRTANIASPAPTSSAPRSTFAAHRVGVVRRARCACACAPARFPEVGFGAVSRVRLLWT